MVKARPAATATNGPPVAMSPRNAPPNHNQYGGDDVGFLSSILCGDPDIVLCDASPNEVDFDVNPTGVYVALHTKQWNLACERVKIYPREASTWVVRYGSPESAAGCASGVGRSSSDVDRSGAQGGAALAMATSPQSGGGSAAALGAKVLRWRMLPLHASLLFGAPDEVVRTFLKAYPAGISEHDDQGMLPLHLAFRVGSSEEIVLMLLEKYPEAIERVDYKGRLPSMLAPKDALGYGDSIAEAYVRGPSYYYWSARVATSDRMRSETAMTAKIKQLEESARLSTERDKDTLNTTQQQLTEEIKSLSINNVELKERLVWYENKYHGAEEKEKILVDHTNSLAERLRLTSLSEEHLATKLAKLEAKLNGKEAELENARATAAEEKVLLESQIIELEQCFTEEGYKVKSLAENLEKKVLESNEMKAQFEKERQLFGKQIDASKDCLMELIASSKEDKRIFEQESKELRNQLLGLQSEVQRASMSEKQMFEQDSQELRRQLKEIQSEVQRASENSKRASNEPPQPIILPQSLNDRLEDLQREVANNARSFMSRVDGLEAEEQHQRDWVIQRQASTTRKIEERMHDLHKEVGSKNIEDRLDSLHKEVVNARSFVNHGSSVVKNMHVEPTVPVSASSSVSERSIVRHQQPHQHRHHHQHMNLAQGNSPKKNARQTKTSHHRVSMVQPPSPHQRQSRQPDHTFEDEEEEPFDARLDLAHSYSSKKNARQSKMTHQKVFMVQPLSPHQRQGRQPDDAFEDEEEEPFDTYVSTKSTASLAGNQSREESDVDGVTMFSHESDVDTAMALGELTEEQRDALESLDLGGTREEIAVMLAKVPGLTMNQVNLLVDVASSLTA
mmetsp:Transcript_8884/g.21575  ORF Transcript_8884/g.21575 Transcript_8884/m.21575 type:complete len:850 (+) Transcript_8884:115-2664(+)